jgi:predicted ferric reductase
MRPPLVYAFAFFSAVLLLLCWRLSQYLTTKARERIFSTFSKCFIYTLLYRRLNGSSDITVLSAILLSLLLAGNVIASVLRFSDRHDFSLRLARLSLTNMVILYFGGRTNMIVDKIFRLSHTEYHLLHRWLGRIAVVEGILHGFLELAQSRWRPPVLELTVSSGASSISSNANVWKLFTASGMIAVLSILFVRRILYEFFLQTHFLLSITVLVLLWLHMHQPDTYLLSCLSLATGLSLFQKILWLIYILRRNYGSGPKPRTTIIRFPRSGLDGHVFQVRIDIKKTWKVKPGQYVYLTLPRLRSLGLGLFESHPFMIAWAIEDEQARLRTVVLLVQVRRGFTQKLQFSNPLNSAIIDGPYGGNEVDVLADYDKILLISSGIGIASHLDTARHLLLAHHRQTARVRRLTVLWLLETRGEMNCTFNSNGLTDFR